MEALKKYAVEVVATIWLAIVAVQYLSRYFIGLDVDLVLAYLGMLCLVAAVGGLRLFRAIQRFLDR